MSKYYKYILSVFLLICIVNVVYLFIPSNPFNEKVSEITINEDVDDYISRYELNNFDFTNYEKNYIQKNDLKEVNRIGRNIDSTNYYSYFDSYFDWGNGKRYKLTPSIDDSLCVNTYLFKNSKTILIKLSMSLNAFKNQYYISIPYNASFNEIDYKCTYEYKETEYLLEYYSYDIKLGQYNSAVYPDKFIISNGSNYDIKSNYSNTIINLSYFVKVDEIKERQGFECKVITASESKKINYTIGFNNIEQKVHDNIAYIKMSYLEF